MIPYIISNNGCGFAIIQCGLTINIKKWVTIENEIIIMMQDHEINLI